MSTYGGGKAVKLQYHTTGSANPLRVPCWCPICGGPMKGRSTSTFYDWGVCVRCFIYFIEGRLDRWKSGWRPGEQDMEGFRLKME